jgi:hypothetical protein
MVQETMNGTGNLDGSGGHEWYRKPGWFRKLRIETLSHPDLG